MDNKIKMRAQKVNFFYGKVQALRDINLAVHANCVTAMIGPSGCGKSTFIRLFNRMNELLPHTLLKGKVFLDDLDINSPLVDAVDIRRRVGMVFQKPNPFPKSIFENISYGLKVNGVREKDYIAGKVEESLKKAALWDEVKERLGESALRLSGGQQQR
ncbi:MAG: ATP-binding cassette domain-containing protein, partial [Candidatus Omnitrophica bacterium]|nr:ATP-binding cassette domain-containing protein [Candidatus Omnitrophota bacterium]